MREVFLFKLQDFLAKIVCGYSKYFEKDHYSFYGYNCEQLQGTGECDA